MKYERFEDLPVWQAAQVLAEEVYVLVEDRAFDRRGDLRNQLQRASLSISNNIAEGFERGSTAELLAFLYIARGSAGETRSALLFAIRLLDRGILKSQISNLKSQIQSLLPRCECVSRQLRGWADRLQNTDIKGQRHLNDQTLTEYRQRHRAEQFLGKLREMTDARRPPGPPESEV